MFKALSIGAILAAIIGAAFFFLIKTSADRAAVQTDALSKAAYQEGLKSGQLATANASNAALAADMKRIAALQQETNERVAAIRSESSRTREVIYTYPAETVAVTRPAEVEAWANKTTTDLFESIEAETQQ